jgi:hypothetical protein
MAYPVAELVRGEHAANLDDHLARSKFNKPLADGVSKEPALGISACSNGPDKAQVTLAMASEQRRQRRRGGAGAGSIRGLDFGTPTIWNCSQAETGAQQPGSGIK